MSDTIDMPAAQSIPPAPTSGGGVETPPSAATADTSHVIAQSAPTPPAAPDLLRLVQGLYFIFWGMLTTVLVAAHLISSIGKPSPVELFLVAGVATTAAGAWRLDQVRGVAGAWRGRARGALWLAALMVNFGIGFGLWVRQPGVMYLLANALAFIGVSMLFVVQCTRALGAMAVPLGRRDMVWEARMLGMGNVVCLVAPFVGGLLYIAISMLRHDAPALAEFDELLKHTNRLVLLALLLPFSLTLSLIWATKDVALRHLHAQCAAQAGEATPE